MPSRRRIGPLEITLIVVNVVLAGVLIFLIATAPAGPDEEPTETTTTGAASPGEEPTTDESESPSSTQAVTVPAGAVEVPEFASPTRNIWCTISEDAATCEIADIEYEPPSISGCEDNDRAGHVLTVTADAAEWVCPEGALPGADPADRTVLEYDQTSAVGDFMCTSTEEGITCTSLTSGASFTVRRAGATLS